MGKYHKNLEDSAVVKRILLAKASKTGKLSFKVPKAKKTFVISTSIATTDVHVQEVDGIKFVITEKTLEESV